MEYGGDQHRKISRRSVLKRASMLVAVPVVTGCTWLDALDDDRNTVEITDQSRFDPAGITVPVGSTVVWRNMDHVRHTVTADSDVVGDPNRVSLPEGAEPWDSGDLSSGEQWSYTFTVPGTYVYSCQHHQADGMVGTVTVEPEG